MVVQSAETGKVRTRLTQRQAHNFMMAVKDHPLEALLFLALTTSMRKGEILGLTWMDVDWEKIILTILLYFLAGSRTKIAVNSLTSANPISHQQFTLEYDGILNTQLTFYPFAE
jgi:integrase